MEDHSSLLQPFIPLTTTVSRSSSSSSTTTSAAASSSFHDNNACDYAKAFSSNQTVIIRLLLFVSVAATSLWANYEASRTFEITLINDAKDSPAGRRFDLFYVSNDGATRVLLNASSFVQHLLYPHPHPYPKKHIRHVTLRLASRNLNTTASVTAKHDPRGGGGNKFDGYVIDLSPSLLEEANYREAMVAAVLRAMARVWLWDGESMAPARLIDGAVEYVAAMAGFGGGKVSGAVEGSPVREDDEDEDGAWWEDKDPSDVARFLRCCEGYKEGFIRRLNEAMGDTWHDRIVDDALGMPAKKLCGFDNAS